MVPPTQIVPFVPGQFQRLCASKKGYEAMCIGPPDPWATSFRDFVLPGLHREIYRTIMEQFGLNSNINALSRYSMYGTKKGEIISLDATILIQCTERQCTSLLERSLRDPQPPYLVEFAHPLEVYTKRVRVGWSATPGSRQTGECSSESAPREAGSLSSMQSAQPHGVNISPPSYVDGTTPTIYIGWKPSSQQGSHVGYLKLHFASGETRFALIGGLVLHDGNTCALTTGHTFLANSSSLDQQDEPKSDNTSSGNMSDTESSDASLDSSCLETPSETQQRPIQNLGDIEFSLLSFDAELLSVSFLGDDRLGSVMSRRSSAYHADWALVPIDSSDLLKQVDSVQVIESRISFAPRGGRIDLLCGSPLAYHGSLLPGPSFLHTARGSLAVTEARMDSPLPKTVSGSWALLRGNPFGHIVACSADGLTCYVLLMEQIFDDIEQVTGSRPSLLKAEAVDGWLRSQDTTIYSGANIDVSPKDSIKRSLRKLPNEMMALRNPIKGFLSRMKRQTERPAPLPAEPLSSQHSAHAAVQSSRAPPMSPLYRPPPTYEALLEPATPIGQRRTGTSDVEELVPRLTSHSPAGATKPQLVGDRRRRITGLDPDIREPIARDRAARQLAATPQGSIDARTQAPDSNRWNQLDVPFPCKVRLTTSIRYHGDPEVQQEISRVEEEEEEKERLLFEDNFTDASEPYEETISDFEWYKKEAWDDLRPTAHMRKLQMGLNDLRDHDLYIRRLHCHIRVGPGPDPKPDLRKVVKCPALQFDRFTRIDDLVKEVIPEICGFIYACPMERFEIVVHWEYSSMRLRPRPESTFEKPSTVIAASLANKRLMNMFQVPYIPLCDLQRFLEYDVLLELLRGEGLSADSAKILLEEVVKRGVMRVLMICFYRNIPLDEFRHLIEYHEDFTDELIDVQLEHGSEGDFRQCPGKHVDSCRRTRKHIKDEAPAFFASFIGSDFRGKRLPSTVALPIHTLDDMHAHPKLMTENPLEETTKGANSTVEFVWVDPSHHKFPGVEKSVFALKKGFVAGRGVVSLRRETYMLDELWQYPHPHIVSHFAWWHQSGVDYILLPKAQSDLRAMMTRLSPPSFNKASVEWFFDQLHGLADALRHFHALGGQTGGTEDESRVRWAVHHGIKPANILVFEKDPSSYPVLKLSDFGAGSMLVARSDDGTSAYKDAEVLGTISYFAPESEEEEAGAAQPFDIWSLGCVFCELLVWIFCYFEDWNGDQQVERFRQLREDFPGANAYALEDKFYWQPKGARSYEVKPNVGKVLANIKSTRCRGMWAFQELIDVVERMLIVDADERLTAAQLETVLKRLRLDLDRETHNLPLDQDPYATLYIANLSDLHQLDPSPNPDPPATHMRPIDTADGPSKDSKPVDDRNPGLTADDTHPEVVTLMASSETLHKRAPQEDTSRRTSVFSRTSRSTRTTITSLSSLASPNSIKDTGIKHTVEDRYISKRRLEAYLEKTWPGGEGTHYAKRYAAGTWEIWTPIKLSKSTIASFAPAN